MIDLEIGNFSTLDPDTSHAAFAAALARPTDAEAREFEETFGQEKFQSLQRLAIAGSSRGPSPGNVIVLPGIMGSELSYKTVSQKWKRIWFNLWRIGRGQMDLLDLGGPTLPAQIGATGIWYKYYADLTMQLHSGGWNVKTFFYDWRLGFDTLAAQLAAHADHWFGKNAPFSIAAHSMGGLVARTFIKDYPGRWKKAEGKLVMLGTPNHGSYAIPRMLTGINKNVRRIAAVDLTKNLHQLLQVLGTFPGAIQMMPSPLKPGDHKYLYQEDTWAPFGRVSRQLLDQAKKFHQDLASVVDGERMHYLAGYRFATASGVRDYEDLGNEDAYHYSYAGDGTVPHNLGLLEDEGGHSIPTSFIEVEHGSLGCHRAAAEAVHRVLLGEASGLPSRLPSLTRSEKALSKAAVGKIHLHEKAGDARLQSLLDHQRTNRSRILEDDPDQPETSPSPLDREVADLVLDGLLGSTATSPNTPLPTTPTGPPRDNDTPVQKPEVSSKTDPHPVTVALLLQDIEDYVTPPARKSRSRKSARATLVSVGHYHGVSPQYAEAALDRGISRIQPEPARGGNIIQLLFERDMIQADLGKGTLIPVPGNPDQTVYLSGMGTPGNLGPGALIILVKNLLWTATTLGHRHLSSVLIGSGEGNLDIDRAVALWMDGISAFLRDFPNLASSCPRLTFLEYSASNARKIADALGREKTKGNSALALDIELPTEAAIASYAKSQKKKSAPKGEIENVNQPSSSESSVTTRLTVHRQGQDFTFSALTHQAAIPQRPSEIDLRLIWQANDQLLTHHSLIDQSGTGYLIRKLLVPDDISRKVIERASDEPIVAILDSTTARIHWEMIASKALLPGDFAEERFLALHHQFSRQLASRFAPFPESPSAGKKTLRALIIADPCERHPLYGALEEGQAVASILEQANTVHQDLSIEVKTLLGPRQATRIAVLEELLNTQYDILHYAGHCEYDTVNPEFSGWLFDVDDKGEKELLTAWELERLDRVPPFVFSNACESGITPARPDARNDHLPASFAESFFARGVTNFICTGWPVNDHAALTFARRFYRGILGLESETLSTETLGQAILQSRRLLASEVTNPGFIQTWAAYQHYGDPTDHVIHIPG